VKKNVVTIWSQISHITLVTRFLGKKKPLKNAVFSRVNVWLRGPDLNRRPSGYEFEPTPFLIIAYIVFPHLHGEFPTFGQTYFPLNLTANTSFSSITNFKFFVQKCMQKFLLQTFKAGCY